MSRFVALNLSFFPFCLLRSGALFLFRPFSVALSAALWLTDSSISPIAMGGSSGSVAAFSSPFSPFCGLFAALVLGFLTFAISIQKCLINFAAQRIPRTRVPLIPFFAVLRSSRPAPPQRLDHAPPRPTRQSFFDDLLVCLSSFLCRLVSPARPLAPEPRTSALPRHLPIKLRIAEQTD